VSVRRDSPHSGDVAPLRLDPLPRRARSSPDRLPRRSTDRANDLRVAAFDGLSAHVCALDQQGTIIAANMAWQRFGATNDAPIDAVGVGCNYLSVCEHSAKGGDPDAAAFLDGLRNVIDGRIDDFEMEYPCHSPTEARWFLARVSRVRGRDPVHTVVEHQNITRPRAELEALRAAQQTLAQSEARYRMLVEQAPSGVFLVDAHGICEEANQVLCDMLGWARDEATGRRIKDFLDPDDLSARPLRVEELRDQGGIVSERPLRHRDGHFVNAEIRARRLVDGRMIGYVRSLDDARRIAAERRAAARELDQVSTSLSTAMSIAGLGLLRTDLHSPQLLLNEDFRRIAGCPAGWEPTCFADVLVRIHPDDRERYLAARNDELGAGPGEVHALRFVHDDGQERHAMVRHVIDRDDLGKPLRISCVVLDVTEQRRIEQALRDKEAAERANRAKSEFLSHMSHELRTPLNAILGFSHLLQAERPAGQVVDTRRHAAHIHRAGRHLLALIDDLLDISRIEIGVLQLRLRAMDAVQETADAMLELRTDADAHEVHLSFDAAPGMPPVRADPTRLRQVVQNLVSNAIKYNRPGGQVVVGLKVHAGKVRIEVSDNGLGMTPEQQARLFQPFDRLGREASEVRGVGLGLAITRHLVDLMGGQLSVHSQPGTGSTFTVDLPMADDVAAGDPDAARERALGQSG